MTYLPTLEQVRKSKNPQPWDFGNGILYKMCKEHFSHKQDDQILAKVLFIGRIYSAAVERRKNKADEINDDFYLDVVIPTFKNSELDKRLSALNAIKKPSTNDLPLILQTHHYLTSTLYKITGLDKRSFSSKFLHFHLPHLYFIYDSRALTGLRTFISRVPREFAPVISFKNVDEEYAKFYCKCFEVKRQIEGSYKTIITNRQFDNILIDVANNIAKKKLKYS